MMIPIGVMVRRRKLLHVTFLAAAVAILELLPFGSLSGLATLRVLIRARLSDLLGVPRFHGLALALVVSIEGSGVPFPRGYTVRLIVASVMRAACGHGCERRERRKAGESVSDVHGAPMLVSVVAH
jgi:hypothetical protein